MNAEDIKVSSRYLAGSIAEELDNGGARFEHDAELLLKFHGIYQQDDRDVRRERTREKLPPDYSCMVRAAVPGGLITREQWLALDRVSALANDRLRLTTRQGVQYHVVHKGDLRQLVQGINASLLTTIAACGDVVRNVMACPLPHPERAAVLQPVVDEMVARFRPRAESYWELWVDGEQAVTAEPARSARRPAPPALDPIDDVEPIYGTAYLPRKFKIGIAWPGDNCVDIYSHDVGLVPTLADGTSGALTGFVVLAGGGMGMSHNRPDDTYPLLAQPIAWVPPHDVGDVVEAIVTTQRDHGNRDDRSRARLKYLLEARGVEWLRSQIADRIGRPIAEPVELLPWTVDAHHGWHEVAGGPGDTLGVPIPSGQVVGGIRTALRRVVADGAVAELRVTPRQDLLLVGVSDRAAVEAVLRSNGVALADDQSSLRNLSIACPALPTCSKALGESERVLPDVVGALEKLLADTGNPDLPIRLNMTGCPNGCARPYSAEIGIVGRTKRNYDVYVGGSPAGDRLATCLRPDVPLDDLPDVLRPVFEWYARDNGTDSTTSFGDWCAEVGIQQLAAVLPEPTSRRRSGRVAASA